MNIYEISILMLWGLYFITGLLCAKEIKDTAKKNNMRCNIEMQLVMIVFWLPVHISFNLNK